MLLPSDRHTAEDLELWSELEAGDFAHGERLFKSCRWRESIELMKEFSEQGRCYVATSWGKDSVVVAHLHAMSGLGLPMVNVAQHGPQYDADCPKVRDVFISAYPQTHYREIVVVADNAGQRDTDKAAGLIEGIRQANQEFGTKRYIGGIRAAESGVRKIGLRSRGLSCGISCQPIGWWSDEDVFGWLAFHRLPVHPAYGMIGGGRYERSRIRVSIIGGSKGRHMGRAEWEREYYGGVLNRLHASTKSNNG